MMYKQDRDRGTGRTTRQMEALPVGGVFVSCSHNAVYYDVQLTRKLNRQDIQVKPPSWVTSEKWKGMEFSAVVLDHYYHVMNKNDPIFDCCWHNVQARVRNAKKV